MGAGSASSAQRLRFAPRLDLHRIQSMSQSRAIRSMLRSPDRLMKFHISGELPRPTQVRGPLIELLQSMPPRCLGAIVGLTIDPRLGYMGSRTFPTAAQALRWVAPHREMYPGESWPAESWRDKRFGGPLGFEHLVECSANVPDWVVRECQRFMLRRPARAAPLVPPAPAALVDDGAGAVTDVGTEGGAGDPGDPGEPGDGVPDRTDLGERPAG